MNQTRVEAYQDLRLEQIIRDQVAKHLADGVPVLAAASGALYELVAPQVSGKDPELVDFKLEVKVEDADGNVSTHTFFVELKSSTTPLPLPTSEETNPWEEGRSENQRFIVVTPPSLTTATLVEKPGEVVVREPSEVNVAERILAWFRKHPEQTVTISKLQDELNKGADLKDRIASDMMRIAWLIALREDYRLQQVTRKSWIYQSKDSDFEAPPEDEEPNGSDPVAPQTATSVAG